MLTSLIIFFSVLGGIALILLIGYVRTFSKDPDPSSFSGESGLSVVIPFHNEEERIGGLIQSINEAHLPSNIEFIFVDDHSTDRTFSAIGAGIRTEFRLVKNEEKKGKKFAIQTGVRTATYNNILTLDADVTFKPVFLIEIQHFIKADIVVFPIRMNGGNLISRLSSFESSWLQLLTFGAAGFGAYPLCNGANLGFKRSSFLEIDPQRDDYEIASGDDIFLLRKMKETGKYVSAVSNSSLVVDTIGPSNLRGVLAQRQRWFGKMTKMIDFLSIIAVFALFLAQIGLVTSIIGLFESTLFLIPIAIKYGIELIIDIAVIRKVKPLRWLLLLLHQLWYPVYLVLLLIPTRKESRWS